MPDLHGLLRTSLVDLAIDMAIGRGRYPDETAFEISVCARLLDKALREWDAARAALIEHAEGRRRLGDLFEASGHMENFVGSLDRLMRFAPTLQAKPELSAFAALTLPSEGDRTRVRQFRNRIAHGDEDLADGNAGRGLPTATLEVRARDIALQGRTRGTLEALTYLEMTTWIEQIYAFIRAAMAKP